MYKVTGVETPTVFGDMGKDMTAQSVASAASAKSRTRTVSMVTSAPRALSVIQREEAGIIRDREREREEKRRDSAKALDAFLSVTRPKSATIDSSRPSTDSSMSSATSRRPSISNMVRKFASSTAIVGVGVGSKEGAQQGGKDKDSRPKMRERDLSDNQFYYVYAMSRQEFKKLSIIKRAWLRSENMHRRPNAGDIEI